MPVSCTAAGLVGMSRFTRCAALSRSKSNVRCASLRTMLWIQKNEHVRRPRVIGSTADASDHPMLVSNGQKTYLSWMTKADGYHLQPIEGEP